MKHNMKHTHTHTPENVFSSILKWLHKNSNTNFQNTNFDKFFLKMYADMTAVTIQSNKIVSNEVKDN